MILTGFGFLSRLHGLSIDNVVEVEMVLADGRIIIVSEEEHPGKYHIPHILITTPEYNVIRALVGYPRRRTCLRRRNPLQS